MEGAMAIHFVPIIEKTNFITVMKTLPIVIPKDKLKDICQRYFIQRLSLFGSVLREDFTNESDIDFLVEFLPERTPGFFKLAQLQRELSELLDRRKVDLRTAEELSPYFRDRVLQEGLVQYDSY